MASFDLPVVFLALLCLLYAYLLLGDFDRTEQSPGGTRTGTRDSLAQADDITGVGVPVLIKTPSASQMWASSVDGTYPCGSFESISETEEDARLMLFVKTCLATGPLGVPFTKVLNCTVRNKRFRCSGQPSNPNILTKTLTSHSCTPCDPSEHLNLPLTQLRAKIMQRISGRVVVFHGDSTQRQWMQMLVCLLISEANSTTPRTWGSARQYANDHALSFSNTQYNFTIRLSAIGTRGWGIPGTVSSTFEDEYRRLGPRDIIIAHQGAHFYYPRDAPLLHQYIQRIVQIIADRTQDTRPLVLWRDYGATHWSRSANGLWTKQCFKKDRCTCIPMTPAMFRAEGGVCSAGDDRDTCCVCLPQWKLRNKPVLPLLRLAGIPILTTRYTLLPAWDMHCASDDCTHWSIDTYMFFTQLLDRALVELLG